MKTLEQLLTSNWTAVTEGIGIALTYLVLKSGMSIKFVKNQTETVFKLTFNRSGKDKPLSSSNAQNNQKR
jgi:hypothetical protein